MQPSSRRLNIIICGGGIGGFATASLLREEHNVTVFEQAHLNLELGAAITFSMNASRLMRSSLQRAGFDKERAKYVEAEKFQELHYRDLSVLLEWPMEMVTKKYGDPWWYFSRADIHSELKRTALSPDGLGNPAHLETGAKVCTVDPAAGTVTLEDGRVLTGDVIIGADGIRSTTGKAVFRSKIQTVDGGMSAYRCMISSAQLRADPLTAPLVDCAKVLMLMAPDRRIVVYPCSSWDFMNFVCIFPDDQPRTSQWTSQVAVETMIATFADFHPAIPKMLGMATDTGVWKLLDREPLENLVQDKFALIGDAAHAMGPHQGQGGCQAIEDAEALRVILAGCTDPSEVPHRLSVYNKLRVERVAQVVRYTRAMAPRRSDDPRGDKVDHKTTQTYSDYYWRYRMTDEAVREMKQNGYKVELKNSETGELSFAMT
ncbi:FAD/NAD(P)-binding domain-containing protein [Zalerion maritima]|uniref:FAD/NAD(P)-binding domain-containing protein n=1 Tax=Zalerion maritima TaxID=339359 RepID=A0AAD5RJ00_9PEZI|nr:FAD/NAD(P)-binding domain-containing protein [Zalerion maritima]